MGRIDHLGGGDGEVEYLHGQDAVHEGLSAGVVGACNQFEQFSAKFAGYNFQIFEDVPRRNVYGIWSCLKCLKLHGCLLNQSPILFASEISTGQHRRANHG